MMAEEEGIEVGITFEEELWLYEVERWIRSPRANSERRME